MSTPKALILRAPGINCERETHHAFERAGAKSEYVHIKKLLAQPELLDGFQILSVPGGFSYGDDISSGRVLAQEMKARLGDRILKFVDRGGLAFGICNGFQVLVKAGLLPGPMSEPRSVTLTENAEGRFECRWVTLQVEPSCRSGWLGAVGGTTIRCPIAHGEGRVAVIDDTTAARLEDGLVAFRYLADGARPTSDDPVVAGGAYPANPNGSVNDIAGICDDTGNIVGLMPHPEDHVLDWQRPSGPEGGSGLPLFEAFVAAAR